jgi:hypothetical protein
MKLWDSFRTAFQLAERVEECESRLSSMESDWTDIQDKLLAREERLRKRLSRELKASLSESPLSESTPLQLSPPEGSQAAKRSLLAAFTKQRQGAQ